MLTKTYSSQQNTDNDTSPDCCFGPLVNDIDSLTKAEYRRQCILRWKKKKTALKTHQHTKQGIVNTLFPSTSCSQPLDPSKQSSFALGKEVG